MLLKENNKIRVNIAVYQMYASVDTRSTISTITKDLFNKVGKTTDLIVAENIANGSTVCVKRISYKIRYNDHICHIFVLNAVHISVIIGCDLLDLLRTQIDFKTKQFLHDVQWLNTARL